MTARRSTIQSFWHRLVTALAFVLTTSLNLAPAPQSEGTRVAKEHSGQFDAAIKVTRDLPQSPSARLDGDGKGGDGGPGPFTLAAEFSFPSPAGAQAPLPAPDAILLRPARLVRAGDSRAPPSILSA